MLKEDLWNVLSAACRVTEEDGIIVVGSQAAYGSLQDDLPLSVETSEDVDVMALDDENTIIIDGAIGEHSRFHETHGFYAHGLQDPLPFPEDWRDNLVDITMTDEYYDQKITCWFLSLPDLCASKLAAGRVKDISFARWVLENEHVEFEDLRTAIEKIPDSFEDKRAMAISFCDLLQREMSPPNPMIDIESW